MKLIDFSTKQAVNATIEEYYDKDTPRLRIKFAYQANIKEEIKNCEGAKWEKDERCWTIAHPANSQRNANVLAFLTNGSIVGSFGISHNFLIDYYNVPLFVVKSSRPLFKHQLEGLKFVLERRRCMLVHEMGTGKTLTTIELMEQIEHEIKDLLDSEAKKFYKQENFFWVIAPKSPLRAWEYELHKWQAKVRPKLIVCDQSRIAQEIEKSEYPPFCLIIDESSRFKNLTAKRTSYVQQLVRHMIKTYGKSCYIVLLTGTPAPKAPTDWQAQIEIICPGFIKQKNTSSFIKEYANVTLEEGSYGSYYKIRSWDSAKLQKLHRRLEPLRQVRLIKDCMDLPEYQYVPIEITPSKRVASLAKLVKNSNTALQMQMKLRQLSDGFMYGDDENPLDTIVHTEKLDAFGEELNSLLEEGETRCVAYASFTKSVDMLVDKCINNGWAVIRVDGRGWTSFSAVDDAGFKPVPNQEQFLDKNLDKPICFVGNPDAGGMGLTLTSSKLILVYSNSFKGESRTQMLARIRRTGMRGALIKDFIYLPTDRLVVENLRKKRRVEEITMGEILSALEELKG